MRSLNCCSVNSLTTKQTKRSSFNNLPLLFCKSVQVIDQTIYFPINAFNFSFEVVKLRGEYLIHIGGRNGWKLSHSPTSGEHQGKDDGTVTQADQRVWDYGKKLWWTWSADRPLGGLGETCGRSSLSHGLGQFHADQEPVE